MSMRPAVVSPVLGPPAHRDSVESAAERSSEEPDACSASTYLYDSVGRLNHIVLGDDATDPTIAEYLNFLELK